MLKLQGTYTAMVTPFKEGHINEAKLQEMVEFQIKNGVSGLVPVGTTGESPTLSHDEHRKVIDIVIKTVNGRVSVIAGTGSNNTTEAISLTQFAQKAGADGALLITPYYNRPSQTGLINHYRAVAENCDLPLIIYNCPGRTAVNTSAETIVKLSEIPTIIGIKEASGSIDQICEIINRTSYDFSVLSGDDSMTVPIISVGGKGVISVTSNIVPKKMSDMADAALKGNFHEARDIHSELFPLMRLLMKAETNPSPVKSAMNILGMDVGPVRLPLTEPSDENKKQIEKLLKAIDF
ncbi:4-hydroxy-tetrahydrodipicolinate synthase [Candidatus Latescibacterota bacterium]